MRDEEELICAVCDAEMPFAPPPTDDARAAGELVCAGCGAVLVIAPVTVWLRTSTTGGVAPLQRQAA